MTPVLLAAVLTLAAPEPPSVTFYTMGCEARDAEAVRQSLSAVRERAREHDVRLILDDATWLCGYALFAGERTFIDGPLPGGDLWAEIAGEFDL